MPAGGSGETVKQGLLCSLPWFPPVQSGQSALQPHLFRKWVIMGKARLRMVRPLNAWWGLRESGTSPP